MRNVKLEQFIAEKIHSIEEVEILALLFRSPDTYWTTTAMAQHLNLKEEAVSAKAKGRLKIRMSGQGFEGGAMGLVKYRLARR